MENFKRTPHNFNSKVDICICILFNEDDYCYSLISIEVNPIILSLWNLYHRKLAISKTILQRGQRTAEEIE